MKKILSILVLSTLVLILFSFIFKTNEVKAQINSSSSNCLFLNYNLKYGARDYNTGSEVSKLQLFLNTKGYLQYSPTGYFGPATRAAVIAYQSNNGLYNIGYVGPLTRLSIYNETCNVNPMPVPNPIPDPTPVQTYYCNLNNQTYYSVTDYNNYCKTGLNQCDLPGGSSTTYTQCYPYYCYYDGLYHTNSSYCNSNTNTFCPTNGDFYNSEYPNCTCPSNLNKVLTIGGGTAPNYWKYKCVSSVSVCPIGVDFLDYNYSGCACPSGYVKTTNGLVGGPLGFFCKSN